MRHQAAIGFRVGRGSGSTALARGAAWLCKKTPRTVGLLLSNYAVFVCVQRLQLLEVSGSSSGWSHVFDSSADFGSPCLSTVLKAKGSRPGPTPQDGLSPIIRMRFCSATACFTLFRRAHRFCFHGACPGGGGGSPMLSAPACRG